MSKQIRFAVCLALAGASSIGEALAQASSVVSPDSNSSLEEVLVTAQRRSESLQDVQTSVVAFGEVFLEERKIVNFEELASLTPSIQYTERVGRPDIFIRGIGSDQPSAAADNSVGAFIDEVYLSRGIEMTMQMFDLERVEIIRGPSSTLYGKNVIGGAVNFVTQKPSQEFDANLRVEAGNYDLLGTTGMVTGPLSERVAARLAFATRSIDGFGYNTLTNHDVGDGRTSAVRGQVLFDLGDVDVLWGGDYSRKRGNGLWSWMDQASARNAPFFNPNPWRHPASERGDHDNPEVLGTSVRVNWKSSRGTLTSITAWRESELDRFTSITGAYVDLQNPPRPDLTPSNPDNLFFNDTRELAEVFSQDVRFASSSFNDRLEWIVGVFAMREDIDKQDNSSFIFTDLRNPVTLVSPFIGGDISIQSNVTDSQSAFAESTWRVSDLWRVTTGLRWSKDSKDFVVTRGGVPSGVYQTPGNVGFTADRKRSWSEWTPRLSIGYEPTSNQNYYLTAARGYKSGAFDGSRDLSPAGATRGVEAETAWNYELGAKTQWFRDRLRLNVAAFFLDYTDLQTLQQLLIDPNLPVQRVLANAGSVEIKGVEAEFEAILLDVLRVQGSYGYVDAEIASTLIINNVDQKGNVARRTPKHKGNLALIYEQPFSFGTVMARVEYSYQDDFFFDNNNAPISRIDAYGLVNANLEWSSNDDGWSVGLWGKNLNDELYPSRVDPIFGSRYVTLGAPRTYGVSLTWRY